MARLKKYKTEEERKTAQKEYRKQYYQENQEKKKQYYKENNEKKKKYYQENKEKKKQYYQENKEKIAVQQAEWYQTNKEKRKQYLKQYYQENKEKIAVQQAEYRQENKENIKQYRQENKEKIKQYNKQYYYHTPIVRANNLLRLYKKADKKYNRGECTITAQWIVDNIFTSKCHYCGKDDWTELGCDRIDNLKPHTEDNVVPCCGKCNKKRGTKSYEEYLSEVHN